VKLKDYIIIIVHAMMIYRVRFRRRHTSNAAAVHQPAQLGGHNQYRLGRPVHRVGGYRRVVLLRQQHW